MSNRKKLIDSLHTAVKALEDDVVLYDWKVQESCNCGVIAQVALGKTRDEIHRLRNPLFVKLASTYERKEDKVMTWRNAIQRCCPITGASGFEIIEALKEAGFERSDLVHLEYLNNDTILAASDIPRKKIMGKREVSRIVEDTPVIKKFEKKSTSNSWFRRLFGIMDISFEERVVMEKTTKIKYEDYVIREEYEKDFYAKKENLILYLKGWIRILEGKTESLAMSDRQKIHADMMVAAANEDYTEAARLRDVLIALGEG